MDWITQTLLFINPLLFMLLGYLCDVFLGKKKMAFADLYLLGLLFVYNQGLWAELINTFTLVW
nr:hypothetical protein [Streptococcus equi]